MNKIVNQVQSTNEHSIFQIQVGNRPINNNHVARLILSMKERYLMAPLIVNQKMEVIDGQHRLKAHKELNLPTYFIENKGYGLEETQLLNQNSNNVGEMLLAPPVVLPDADTSLSHAVHGNKTLVVPDLGGNRTFTLPAPTKPGQHFHFIYGGAAADASNALFATATDNSVYMKGGINWVNNNDTSDDGIGVWSDGNSNELLTLVTPETFDIHFLAYSTTVWYIWCWGASVTILTIGD